jgi:hypothetical protein
LDVLEGKRFQEIQKCMMDQSSEKDVGKEPANIHEAQHRGKKRFAFFNFERNFHEENTEGSQCNTGCGIDTKGIIK